MTVRDEQTSPLDRPSTPLTGKPFAQETLTLLRSVRDHNYNALAALCDDDFGIVDGDHTGRISIIRTRAEWEQWFRTLFATLGSMGARTDSEVTRYDAQESAAMGFSALEFRQLLGLGEHQATFDCVATIVWKRTATGWKEARWHVSIVSADVPEAMRPPD